jgi:hypothetical protein
MRARPAPRLTLLALFFAIPAFAALAQQPAATAPVARPLNDSCPISSRPASPTITAVHIEETIAFCCTGCRNTFAGWEDQKKFDYVAKQVTLRAERQLAPPPLLSKDWPSDLYTLSDCPITLGKLGSMGEPPVHMVDGREVRFGCAPCLPKFERKKDRWADVDARMIEAQLPHYPLETCVVSGKALSKQAQSRIHKNRLVRFADAAAIREFQKNPAPHLAKLDAAVIHKQRAAYPLETCIVTGRALGVGAQPGNAVVEIIVANRLVRLSGPEAADGFKQSPAAHLATLEAAWKGGGTR